MHGDLSKPSIQKDIDAHIPRSKAESVSQRPNLHKATISMDPLTAQHERPLANSTQTHVRQLKTLLRRSPRFDDDDLSIILEDLGINKAQVEYVAPASDGNNDQ